MNSAFRTFCSAATIFAALTVVGGQAPESQQPAAPAAQTDLVLKISGSPGAPPHYAVPDFIPLTQDKETVEAARLIAQVLWDDLAFEREFDMIPRDTYKTIEQTPSADTIAFITRSEGASGFSLDASLITSLMPSSRSSSSMGLPGS